MRSSSKKRTTAKESELAERIRDLEERVAASVPKAELEAVKSNLQSEINDLKTIHAAESPKPELPEDPCNEQLEEKSGVDEPKRVESMRGENGLRTETNQTESLTEDRTKGGAEDSETTDSEDAEDSEEPESAESCIQSQIKDQQGSAY
jgi:hypothetical protein